MLPLAVTPASLHAYRLRHNSDNRGISAPRLPFSVHSSKFRSLQALFFDTLTDTPGVGSTQHQTLPKMEPATTNRSAHPALRSCDATLATPLSATLTKFAGGGALRNSTRKGNTGHRRPDSGGGAIRVRKAWMIFDWKIAASSPRVGMNCRKLPQGQRATTLGSGVRTTEMRQTLCSYDFGSPALFRWLRCRQFALRLSPVVERIPLRSVSLQINLIRAQLNLFLGRSDFGGLGLPRFRFCRCGDVNRVWHHFLFSYRLQKLASLNSTVELHRRSGTIGGILP
jgi:hypothetical protein